jgi:hypothetical protein
MYIYYILHIFNNYVYLQSILISCLKSQNTNVFKGFGGGGGGHTQHQSKPINNKPPRQINTFGASVKLHYDFCQINNILSKNIKP